MTGRAAGDGGRRWRALLATGVVAGLTAASIGGGAALAAVDDRAEAEGLLLSGQGGAIDLDSIAALAGAYGAFPPSSETDAPLDVSLLSAIDLGLGLQLFGPNSVVSLGAVGQYQRSDATGSYAASGLLGADGAIQVGTGAPGQNTTLNLTPVLAAAGADTLISDLSIELGAVSASATAARTAGGATQTGDYQISSGVVSLEAPLLAALFTDLDTSLTATGAAVTALGADGGPIDGALSGIVGALDELLEDLLPGGLIDLEDPTVNTTLALDLSGVLDTATATPFVSGPVTLTLGTGEVVIDLDEIVDLNNLGVGQEILDPATINAAITTALSDILTVQLPAAVGAALNTVLNSTALNVSLDAGVTLNPPFPLPAVDIGNLQVLIDGTVGGLLGTPGSTPTTVSLGDTEILGLPIGDLLDPVIDLVTAAVLPLITDAIETVLTTDAVEDAVTLAATGAVTALAPLVDVLNDVVSLQGNVQESPGDFRDPDGLDAGSFTQRALQLTILPAAPVLQLSLASATVRAVALAAPTVTSLVPDRGPETGGTEVLISGTNLGDVTEVTFDGVPAVFVDNGDGTITATTPPHAPAIVTVGVTNVDGTDTSQTFEYFNVASVEEIDPDSGSTLGGDDITITGECFTGATGVTFGGVAGTDFLVVSDTEITVTTPAGAEGAVDVVILNPTECGEVTVEDGFTYVTPGAPTISDIDPDRGPETGGTVVTITGTDFQDGATTVTFDGVDGTDVDVISDTELEVTTPPHAPGVVDVIVTNGTGPSAPFDFEYYNVTEIDGVDPEIGPEAGGQTVVITGDCFTDATNVTFGGVDAADFTVDSDTQITATTPAGVGVVDVVVEGVGDCGDGVLEDGYEFVAPPVIDGLEPTEGPESGGTLVTIEGEGFTDATGVTFDGLEGLEFAVESDTEITVVTPAHAPGVVDVIVLHPGGDTLAGEFEFLNEATVTSIDPTSGPEDGGTLVTILGEGFTGTTAVTFDGIDGTDLTLVDDFTLTVVTPAHVPATVDVVVEHPNGNTEPVDFTYVAGTEVTGVDPGSGPEAGGNEVTITGVCFTGATDVLFDGVSALEFDVVNDTTIVATVPAGTGTVDVTVVGNVACGTDSLPDGYEYIAPPVVDDLTPVVGPETGGTVVTITGEGFTGTTGVTFDGIAGTDYVFVDDTEIQITTPAHAPGIVDVVVLHPGGDTLAGEFEFLNVPSIVSIDPAQGPEDGGTVVTITGEGFLDATGVTFDGIDALDYDVIDDTTIEAITPPHVPATVDVVVTSDVEDSAPAEFLYIAGTEIDDITPPGGPEEGGTEVTITGECFTDAEAVFFGDVEAEFTVVDDNTIIAIAPPGVGVVDVTVVGSDLCGTDTVPDGYEYTDEPVIGTIVPNRGPVTGGTVVTITGSNFDGVTSVSFNAVAGTALTVVSDTELTITTPPGTVGDAAVLVIGPEGTSDPGVFTYYATTTVTDSDPDRGPVGGGTTVTITGSCFTGATAVRFGGVPATSFTIVSDTVIRAVTPAARAAGAVDITVTGGGDCGTSTLRNGFTYVAGGTLPATGGTADVGVALLGGLLLLSGVVVTMIRRRRNA